jgi:hypothetical protein
MPMGGMGGAGEGREHRNNIYLPSDDPFHIDITDDTVPAVLTNEHPPMNIRDRTRRGRGSAGRILRGFIVL